MINKIAVFGNSAAKSATRHWLMQRITALALVPLSFQLIVFLDLCINAPYQQTVDWLKSPLNTMCIDAWLLAVFYHAAMGLQVVIEDYVADQGLQAMLIKAINLGFLFLAVASLFFMFRII
ncbi:succinate dehydrogenase, hydrophobic membrane anchor protein [Methyloglobulus sp.]|uniref:succinate dehydrogenase, hydrophobic membrane anchor protein n=1 Tax=Methyloglobulus sp. TaxID=2518622 RepID=UPI00398980F9